MASSRSSTRPDAIFARSSRSLISDSRSQLDAPRLDLRQVEQVVDQRQQVLAAGLNQPELLLLVGGERAGQLHQHQAGKADDGVQRRAQLVAHGGEKAVLGAAGAFELFVLLAQREFEAFALADVADRAHHQAAGLGVDRAQADLDRELLAAGAHAVQLAALAHRPHARRTEEAEPMAQVHMLQPLRQQQLDGCADHRRRLVAEQAARLRVEQHDATGAIDDHDGIGRVVEHRMETFMHEGGVAARALAGHVGKVADQVRDLAPFVAHGTRAAVDVQRHAVLALAKHLVAGREAIERLHAHEQLVVAQLARHDQLGQRAPLRFAGAVAEGRFGGPVPQSHAAVGMHGDERIGRLRDQDLTEFSVHSS